MKLFLNVAETATAAGVAERTIERLVATGRFPAVRIGRRLVVPVAALHAMASAALKAGGVIDAAEWAAKHRPADDTPDYAEEAS